VASPLAPTGATAARLQDGAVGADANGAGTAGDGADTASGGGDGDVAGASTDGDGGAATGGTTGPAAGPDDEERVDGETSFAAPPARRRGALTGPSVGVGGAGALAVVSLAAAGSAAGASVGSVQPLVTSPRGRRRLRADLRDRWYRLLAVLRYSRYDDSDPLAHDTREALFEVVERSPGLHMSAVADAADASLSTARHHLRVLDDEDLVTVAKVRGKRRYFPGHEADPPLLAALSEPATRRVLEALADHEPAPTGRLADALEKDASTVSHHLSRLAEDGLVERERDGRAKVNSLAPKAARALGEEAATPAVADD
jgi:DNA-binding transcriptional ArsR family regulator